jgi:hypothetical protein
MEDEGVTFITVPKPQTIDDQIEMAKLVLTVWLSYEFTNILMFTTEDEYDPLHRVLPPIRETFGPNRISFYSNLSTGYENRTLVRAWFVEGFRLVRTGYICFTNGDIIIPPLWMQTASDVFFAFREAEKSRTIVYGTRTDVHRLPEIFNISLSQPGFMTELVDYLKSHVRCNNPYGMDIVFMHSSFNALDWTELPGFVVGMCVWDNFFMGWANRRCNTVTMNFNPRIFHVDHPPNACNDENYDYFRGMSYRSPHFGGFQEHTGSTWFVNLDERRLDKRWNSGSSLRL